MFDNIGGKIKALSSTICWIGIIVSCIGGLVVMFLGSEAVLIGLLYAGLGSLASWIGSFMLYGYGQMIENTDRLVRLAEQQQCNAQQTLQEQCIQPTPVPQPVPKPVPKPAPTYVPPSVKPTTEAGRNYQLRTLNKLLSDGLISREEYDRKVAELR